MRRLVLIALAVALGTACAKQPVALYMDPQSGGESGHYVLIAAKGNGVLRVYDCLSRPEGTTWRPTCIQADLK